MALIDPSQEANSVRAMFHLATFRLFDPKLEVCAFTLLACRGGKYACNQILLGTVTFKQTPKAFDSLVTS